VDHLTGDGSLPDQLVEPVLVAAQMALQLPRQAMGGGGTDRLVGLLRVLGLGLVGAGGIGFYIINYIKFFEYGKAAVFMLVVLITVLIIDWVSVRIRDNYIIKSQRGMQVRG